MKRIAFLMLLLSATSSIFAVEQKIITVMDFETSGVSEQEMTLFVDYLSSSVSDYEDYKLIDRRQREIILAEAQFSNSGCADESCAIEIGQLLSASEMIVGSLGSIGSRYLLNIKLIDVETGETIEDVSEKYSSIDELVDGSEDVIAQLISASIKNDSAIATNNDKTKVDSTSVSKQNNETAPEDSMNLKVDNETNNNDSEIADDDFFSAVVALGYYFLHNKYTSDSMLYEYTNGGFAADIAFDFKFWDTTYLGLSIGYSRYIDSLSKWIIYQNEYVTSSDNITTITPTEIFHIGANVTVGDKDIIAALLGISFDLNWSRFGIKGGVYFSDFLIALNYFPAIQYPYRTDINIYIGYSF